MSVINKMLRDLDQRDGAAKDAAAVPTPAAATRTARPDATPLPQLSASALDQRRLPWLAVLAAGALGVLVLGAWWWQKANVPAAAAEATATPMAEPTPPAVPAPPPMPTPKLAEQTPAVAKLPEPPVAVPAAAAASPAPLPLASKPIAVKQEGTPVQPAALAPIAKAVAPAPIASVASVAPVAKGVTPTPQPLAVAGASPPAAATVSAATAEPAGGAARQLQAGREALAQAQSLWSAGSHDAATDLLQGAITAVERSAGTAPTPAQTQLLASLARELGRMHLADGRPAAALDALTRVEPQLGREADIWAMRGNAAQRLGKHQDSVNAYATALQLRPNEQRWLLGSAVSMAALGQTANATEMADKARALGPISKEVQAYLRQAGVRVSEP